MVRSIIGTVLALIAALSSPVFSNNLLLMPTGTTLTTGQVRAEAAFSPDNNNGTYCWLGTGLMQYEINLLRVDSPSARPENQVGFQWNFLPETMITPAISFGVRDAADQSKEGIAPYFAITRHLPLSEMSPLKEFALTFGVGAIGISGPFFGFEAKLPGNFFVQGEYFNSDINAAAGWQPSKHFRLKAYSLQKEFYYGAEIVPISF